MKPEKSLKLNKPVQKTQANESTNPDAYMVCNPLHERNEFFICQPHTVPDF